MTGRHRANETFKSIAGGSMVGLGLHVLWGNLDGMAAQLRPFLVARGEGPGGMSSVILVASQAVQAYAFNHQGFLQDLRQVSVSLWPLLLVIVGTILSRGVFTDEVKHCRQPTNTFRKKMRACRFRFPSFDV